MVQVPVLVSNMFLKTFFSSFQPFFELIKFESNFSMGWFNHQLVVLLSPAGFILTFEEATRIFVGIPPESRKTPSLLSLKCMVKPTTTHTASLLRPRFFFSPRGVLRVGCVFQTPRVVWCEPWNLVNGEKSFVHHREEVLKKDSTNRSEWRVVEASGWIYKQ